MVRGGGREWWGGGGHGPMGRGGGGPWTVSKSASTMYIEPILATECCLTPTCLELIFHPRE